MQSTPDKPLEGVGQGNGCGPKSWLSNDTVIGEAYQEATKAGIRISNPDGSKTFFQYKISYVDDNKLLYELQEIDFSAVQNIQQLINDLECWAFMVHASGGEISWPKSWYQLITWKLEKGTEIIQIADKSNISLAVDSIRKPGDHITLQHNDAKSL